MWLARKPRRKGHLFAAFCLMMGIERFLVEFVRAKDDRFLGPFTVAQLISVILVIVGIVMMARRDPKVAPVQSS